MSTKFTVDDATAGILLQELTAVTAYAQNLLSQVTARASGEAASWGGEASTAFSVQMQKWLREGNAMVTEAETLALWIANAREQYNAAGQTLAQGWA